MSTWEAVLLGFVQGATEFLPVSSSGHLVITQALLDLRVPGVFFEVALHVATLLSVLLVYRSRVAKLASGAARGERSSWRYLALLVLATVPAAVVGLLFRDPLERLFDHPAAAGIGLVVTGAILWSARGPLRREGPERPPDGWTAVAMGLAQAVAIVPGVSRSGATVVAGLWLGLDAVEAAAFSFLMAVPAIAGAAVLEAPEILAGSPAVPGSTLLVGCVVAGATGVVAIITFVALLRRRAFHRFALYCWAVGAGFLTWLALA